MDGEPGTSLPSRLGARGHSCSWPVEVSRVSKAMNVSVAMSDTVTKTSSQDAKERPSPPAIPVFMFSFFSVTDSYYHLWGKKKVKEDRMKRQLMFPDVQFTHEQSYPEGSFPRTSLPRSPPNEGS
ncbi:unnamed protein product [Rangifer tarandus platyrhynchus]|uniref:Uncharacterized protein n=2 Tax=Rangifer tarandus platyrhynchus TaxID=3082113 RepID=A0AC60A855_RANTA|nr:unnamed protein product [Rangifer tarandus platyrhynchus]